MRDAILSVNEKEFILRVRLRKSAAVSPGSCLTLPIFARRCTKTSAPMVVVLLSRALRSFRRGIAAAGVRAQTQRTNPDGGDAWPAQLRDDGNCEVQLGHTRVLAVVSAELVRADRFCA